MQTSTSSSSSSTAVAVAANGTESSAAATPSTSDEFEAIFNQMTALVSTIDEELEHSAASTKQRSSAGGGGESTSNLSNQNSSTNSTTANSLKMKSLGSSGGPEFYHHLNHHHQFSHYHSQSLDDPHHPTIITSSSSTTTSTTNGHRTDSPDADSAFSDSISLVSSTEQSSSSSSSSSTTSSTSGKCSSASSNGVQPQTSFHPHHHLHLHQNNSPSTSSSSLPIPPPPPPLITSSNVINSFVPGPNSPLNLTAINSNSSSSTMLSEKLMNSCNIGTSPSLSSTTSSGTISATSTTSTSSISTSSNIDHQLMALNQQQELFFEQLGRCTTATESNQKQNLMKSPTKSEKQGKKGFDGKKSGKDEGDDDDDALYLKVFAQDNSAKSLLADERMNIGAICGQLAAKNHISLDSSLCIIEHMPHLYLERFFEDHESLVENVLHWGRDSANKLYFMQRADKYDLFHRPERYLISSSSTENTSTKNSSSSSSNDSTLKSSSGPASEFLRRDLIQQFFNSSQNSGANKVPEVEGELYLRAEGKKTWKKYFFTLRSSGLYYCPTGKLDKNGGQKPSPKSTKELLCLATFDLNSVYLGFGWKKKFKAPTDFGFALKHPQVQAKAPKHIKYLCAENEDQLRLWLTGVRIAKYGRQLWSNWEAFRQEGTNTGKSSEEEKLSKPSANFDSSEYYHQQSTQSVTMRSNRNGLNRDESARSSSTSSASSGCLSEGVASTGSGTTSVSNPGVHHQLNHHLNFHHHHQNGGLVSPMDGGSLHYLGSPTHNNGNFGHFASSASNQPQSTMSLSALPHFPQNSSSSGFDTDSFPLGTIKRKPSVQSMPKIPLTKNTRNLALQSEDVLLEHEGEAEGTAYDPHSMMMGSHSVDHDQQIYSGTGVSEVVSPFQRGTFLSGTLRRSTTEERMRANKNNQNNNNFNQMMMMNSSSVLNSSSPLHLPNPASIVQTHHLPHVNGNVSSYLAPPPAPINSVNSKSDSEDDLPLPPPPPTLLKESESTLSLASANAAGNSASFPPPPPMEVLQPSSPILQQNIQQQNLQQTSVVSTISTAAAAAYGSMTPQPQPKNGARLNRRLSDLSSNSTFFLNNGNGNSFNNRNGVQQPQEFNFNQQQQQFPQSPQSPSYHLMAANSRASIATSGENGSSGLYGPSAGFVTLKPYHNRGASISGSSLNGGGLMNSRHHRQLTLDLNAALNKYGTAPRLRNDQQQLLATMARDYEVQNQNLHQNGGSTFNGGVSSPSSPSLPPNSSIYQPNNSPSSYHHQNSIPFNSNQYNGNNETMPFPPQQQSHPQMLYQQQQSYLQNGQSLPSPPPPPPPPAPQNFQSNTSSAINSRPSTNENVIYMSISPHLLQKHQAMAVVNDVYQAHQQPIYGPTPITPLSPSLPPPPPPEQIFLKSMERVMAKKWHVAQMLRSTESEYYGSTPGQVLGFRDPAYLPPREGQIQQQQQPYQQQQMAYQQTAPPPPPPPQMPYYPYQQQQGPPGPIYQQQQQQIYGTQQGAQQIYAGGSSLGKRVPPPPPKRSENTHLTLGQQQQQQQSSRR